MLVPTWMVDEGRVLFIINFELDFNLPHWKGEVLLTLSGGLEEEQLVVICNILLFL